MLPVVAALLSQGLGVLGNAVLAKGKEVVEEKLGVKLPSGETPLTSDQVFSLRKLELEHEDWLIEANIEMAKIALEEKQLEVDNTKSARDMNTRIQESANADPLAKRAAYYLDFAIVAATISMFVLIIFKAVPPENKEIFYTAFGTLLAMCSTIINFHRGTSASSKAKDDAINKMAGGV